MNSLKVFIEGGLQLNFAEGLLDDQDLFQLMKSGISALESDKERDDVCRFFREIY